MTSGYTYFVPPLIWGSLELPLQLAVLAKAWFHMGVSKNRGTSKSSILIGFSIINHPFWGTPIFGNPHMYSFVHWFGFNVSYTFKKKIGRKQTAGDSGYGVWRLRFGMFETDSWWRTPCWVSHLTAEKKKRGRFIYIMYFAFECIWSVWHHCSANTMPHLSVAVFCPLWLLFRMICAFVMSTCSKRLFTCTFEFAFQ